jgi:hypothetical protein
VRVYLAGCPGGDAHPVAPHPLLTLFLQGHKLYSYAYAEEREKGWFTLSRENKVDLMIDSGAHSLYQLHVYSEGHRGTVSKGKGYDFYQSREFWDFVDQYAAFLKENQHLVTVYINVDVIFNPELSWKVLRYLEKEHGLHPLPVIHYGTDLKWLRRHLNRGYEYIGLGGLGQEVTRQQYIAWADRAFEMICDTPDKLPLCKVHGFAMTSLRLMLRWPWYSVDSTSWVMNSRMGSIFVPRKKNGEWTYDENAWKVVVSSRSPATKEAGQHFLTISPRERALALEYIKEKGFRLGRSSFKEVSQGYNPKEKEEIWAEKKPKDSGAKRLLEIIEEPGISNVYQLRDQINVVFWLDLERSLPPWPQPFRKKSTNAHLF